MEIEKLPAIQNHTKSINTRIISGKNGISLSTNFAKLFRTSLMTTYVFILWCTNGFGKVAGEWHPNLPVPTGKFGIGRITVDWTDSNRIEILASDHRYREVQVDIWYPTDKKYGRTAPYLNFRAFDKYTDRSGLESLIGIHSANLIRTGLVLTHAVENAPFSRQIKLAPGLIFSHGMGMITQLYTAQIEDLVSNGYIVVSITHPYDAWLTIFHDGRCIPFERTRREAAGNSEEDHISYENTRIEWWANDIRFVISKLISLNQNPPIDAPFVGHLNIQRIGAFGHSVGGRAAARACQLDNRICACADQDGLARMMPFYLTKEGQGMKQSFLLIMREQTIPPTNNELKQMGLTRLEANTLMRQIKKQRDSALAATGSAFRVVLNFNKTDHMSFSDLPLLQARNMEEAEVSIRIFRVTSAYTKEFFDKELLGVKAPLFDRKAKLDYVDYVQQYLPAQHNN